MEPEHTPPYRLITLGRIALLTPNGEDADLGRRRRKLALLAVLALSPEPLTRGQLASMFWGDEAPDRARHSLSDTLSHLRRVLGRDAITARQEVIELTAQTALSVDALDLERAFTSGDSEAMQALYRGPFLPNVSSDGQGFEAWAAPRRTRYAELFELSKKRAAPDASKLETAPPAASLDSPLPPSPRPRSLTLRRSRWVPRTIASTFLGVAGAGIALVAFRKPATAPTAVPIVALTDVWTDPADTSIAWLRDGLTQMMAGDLARVASARIVAPDVVREASRPRADSDSLTSAESLALARRLHGDWVGRCAISRHNGTYVVTVSLGAVYGDASPQRFVFSGDNVLSLADQASAKILAVLDAASTGPRLADVETANTDAYRHFVRGEALLADARIDSAIKELDAAIAADSGFSSAIAARLRVTDGDAYPKLKALFDRARPRMTNWDRLSEAIDDARGFANPARAESLARTRVALYPRDPRALRGLAELYTLHAAYASAESTYWRLVALDSGIAPSGSACWGCDGYGGIGTSRHFRGDFAGEIDANRRRAQLWPASASAWHALADALTLDGPVTAAEGAYARSAQLTGTSTFDPATGRMFLFARRYDDAEAYARRYLASDEKSDAYELLIAVMRERGQFRAALQAFDAWHAAIPGAPLELVRAHMVGELGEQLASRALFERGIWHPSASIATNSPIGANARGFSWTHALEADAIRERADTALLRALADSIEFIGSSSYYARDWQLFHHVRGIIDERAGRLSDARREFGAALSLVPGWTRTNIELARVDIALGDPIPAIATLRQAWHEPLDAMGHYASRTEIAFQMAAAMARAGQRDSAMVYASYVRAAWSNADPVFRARLATLPR